MNEQLKTHIEDYKKTEWEALLRVDLGEHNLKALKPDLDFIKKFMDDIIENSHKLLIYQNNLLVNLFLEFTSCRTQIETHTDTRQNDMVVNNIKAFRDRILDHYKDLSTFLETRKRYGLDKTSRSA